MSSMRDNLKTLRNIKGLSQNDVLLALLLRSAMFLVNNTSFVVWDGAGITSENKQVIEKRFARLNAAD